MLSRALLAATILGASACAPPPATLGPAPVSGAAAPSSADRPISPRQQIVQRAVDEARQVDLVPGHLLEISRVAAEEIVDTRPSAPRPPPRAPRTAAERQAAVPWELAVLNEQKAVLEEMRTRLEREARTARQSRLCEDQALDTVASFGFVAGAPSARSLYLRCISSFRRTHEYLGR